MAKEHTQKYKIWLKNLSQEAFPLRSNVYCGLRVKKGYSKFMKCLFWIIVVFAICTQTAMSDTFDLPQIEKEECKNMQDPVKVNTYMNKHKETFESFDNTPTQKVTATSIFRNFSGNANPMFNHPAIYAHGKKDPKVTVIGCGSHKEFPLSQLEKAFEEYRLLLILNGYKE